jgi:hypothetical protein
MPKSLPRNELVAEHGAAIWIGLTDRERRAWVELAINDFQDRVVAWKEKEAIEAMLDVQLTNDERANGGVPQIASADDERHAADFRARTLQFSTVKTALMKPSKGSNNNSVLQELLHDSRFHPVPLISARRGEKDLSISKQSERAVEQFEVQGPVRTR